MVWLRLQPEVLRVVERAVVAGCGDRFAVDLDHEVGAIGQFDRQVAVRDRLADRVAEVGAGREPDDLTVGDDRLAADRVRHLLERERAQLASDAGQRCASNASRPQKSPLVMFTRQLRPASHGDVSGVMSVDQ